MDVRCRWLTAALIVLVALAGGVPVAGGVPRVAAPRPVAVDGARLLGLSPDGRWLVGTRKDPNRLCAFDPENLAERACADLKAAGYAGAFFPESAAWAPDGRRLAFTEDMQRAFHESDVWVFDPATGALTDLTDDGARGSLIRPAQVGPRFDLDSWPAWSPDGTAIAFVRGVSEDGDWRSIGLYRIAAGGGAAVAVAALPVADPHDVFPTLRWTGAGELVYSSAAPMAGPADGLWAAAAIGQGPPRRVAAAGARGVPLLVETSARDQALVVWGDDVLGGGTPATPYALVDLASGVVAAVPTEEAIASPWKTGALVAFSPEGGALLYVTDEFADPGGTARLLLLDLATERTRVLLADTGGSRGGLAPLGLTWTADGLVFVPGMGKAGGRGLLLRLEDGAATSAASAGKKAIQPR